MNLAGTTAVLTGSSSGIGLATCCALLDAGASVFGLSRRETPIAHERFCGLKTGVTIETEIDRAFEAVFTQAGRVELLLNNGGFGFFRDIESIDPAD